MYLPRSPKPHFSSSSFLCMLHIKKLDMLTLYIYDCFTGHSRPLPDRAVLYVRERVNHFIPYRKRIFSRHLCGVVIKENVYYVTTLAGFRGLQRKQRQFYRCGFSCGVITALLHVLTNIRKLRADGLAKLFVLVLATVVLIGIVISLHQ